MKDLAEEVPLARYLEQRRAQTHLFEISPDLDGAETGTAGETDVISGIASIVRARGDRETDVCLLLDNGERHLGLARDLADRLRCDVYLTPRGAAVRYWHLRSAATGDLWEAIAVDEASGEPAQWLVVRPTGLPAIAPTWFTSVHGRLRPGEGLVTVDLPDGVAFATRTTYRDTALLAARLLPSAHPLTTLAVNAESGQFEIARFDEPAPSTPAVPPQRRLFGSGKGAAPTTPAAQPHGEVIRLGGADFGTLVRSRLPHLHPDVQIAVTWPKDATGCATLHAELLALAAQLDRTVWVPEPPGAAFALQGFGEFAAVDEVGSASRWRAYPPPSAVGATTLFGTDLDGRLSPLGEVSAARYAGVRFVSVPPAQVERLRPWYSAIAPPNGLFPIDLAVLPDGRLGIMLAHGVSVVAGPRELRELLREAGWLGEEILLLAQPPAQVWNATIDHARGLVEGLRTDLWLATLGAQVCVQPDGTFAADAPEGSDAAWCCVAFGRTAANVTLPPALSAPRYTTQGMPRPALGGPVSRPLALPAGPATELYDIEADLTGHLAGLPAAPVSPGLPALPARTALALPAGTSAGFGLGRALGVEAPHGVAWLPASPAVNPRAMDVSLWTPSPGDRAEAWTLPSADLFLLAGADPLRLAERRPTGYLLRLRVPERAAVDLADHARHAPAAVQQRVAETGATHLLPLAWLRDLRASARFDLDSAGGVRARTEITAGELAIRFEGAGHGVTGLPNEVVHWPDKGNRADAPCYLLLPDESRMSLEIVHGGFVALARRKPLLDEGFRLLEVRVRRRRAIDIPATLDGLAGMPVTGRVHDFVGLDLLLPEADLDQATVTKIWRRGAGNRNAVDKLNGESLYDALLDESILSGRRIPALSAA